VLATAVSKIMASPGASWALKVVREASMLVSALASSKEKLGSSSQVASKVEAHDVKKAAAAWSEVERRPKTP
jgi:hypothetical protein